MGKKKGHVEANDVVFGDEIGVDFASPVPAGHTIVVRGAVIDLAHIGKIHIELDAQTDRGVAILGTALLDELLEKALKRHFRVDDKETACLFDPDRALGSFAAKTRLAYAMGIVSKLEFGDLLFVGKIRNRFAHRTLLPNKSYQPEAVTFDTTEIAALVAKLGSWDEYFGGTDEESAKRSNRDTFLVTFRMLMVALYRCSNA